MKDQNIDDRQPPTQSSYPHNQPVSSDSGAYDSRLLSSVNKACTEWLAKRGILQNWKQHGFNYNKEKE